MLEMTFKIIRSTQNDLDQKLCKAKSQMMQLAWSVLQRPDWEETTQGSSGDGFAYFACLYYIGRGKKEGKKVPAAPVEGLNLGTRDA